jgi:hypothetical protein
MPGELTGNIETVTEQQGGFGRLGLQSVDNHAGLRRGDHGVTVATFTLGLGD